RRSSDLWVVSGLAAVGAVRSGLPLAAGEPLASPVEEAPGAEGSALADVAVAAPGAPGAIDAVAVGRRWRSSKSRMLRMDATPERGRSCSSQAPRSGLPACSSQNARSAPLKRHSETVATTARPPAWSNDLRYRPI